jgi:hypothetical protein
MHACQYCFPLWKGNCGNIVDPFLRSTDKPPNNLSNIDREFGRIAAAGCDLALGASRPASITNLLRTWSHSSCLLDRHAGFFASPSVKADSPRSSVVPPNKRHEKRCMLGLRNTHVEWRTDGLPVATKFGPAIAIGRRRRLGIRRVHLPSVICIQPACLCLYRSSPHICQSFSELVRNQS